MKKIFIPFLFVLIIFVFLYVISQLNENQSNTQVQTASSIEDPTPTLITAQKQIPRNKTLLGGTHEFQTFNNCGPAALSMALSYYGITISQVELGRDLRPYQDPQGDNDDKSVTLAELAKKSEAYNLAPIHRPGGTIATLRSFITLGYPVITRTWTKSGEDIGHFRIIKGFNQDRQEIIQDDSLQGKDLSYSYADFEEIWEKFNFEYLVLVPPEKLPEIELIIGENMDEKTAWNNAVYAIRTRLDKDPDNYHERFNLSVAYFNTGQYNRSVEEFEKARPHLTNRTLWYQIEPIRAYAALGNDDKVFEITDIILNGGNRAFSELYLLRGHVHKKNGNIEAARREFEYALRYNNGMEEARVALETF